MLEEKKKTCLTIYDKGIQETANDALKTKCSTEALKYYNDPFLHEFNKKKHKFFPMINRGTWSRVYAVSRMLLKFVDFVRNFNETNNTNIPVQILSLGAGFDTSFFNLKSTFPNVCFNYIEVDYQEVVVKKIEFVKKSSILQKVIAGEESSFSSKVNIGKSSLESSEYKIYEADLRDQAQLEDLLKRSMIDTSIPIFIIAECVLVYLKQQESINLLSFFSEKFKNLAVIEYEVISPFDEFGRRMKENLLERNCILFGIEDTPDIESHVKRYEKTGFTQVEVYDMLKLYDKIISKEERNRIEKIELLDEFEEWNLIQSHYCFGVGVKNIDKKYEAINSYLKLDKL